MKSISFAAFFLYKPDIHGVSFPETLGSPIRRPAFSGYSLKDSISK